VVLRVLVVSPKAVLATVLLRLSTTGLPSVVVVVVVVAFVLGETILAVIVVTGAIVAESRSTCF
jgi:hypothetical protein